MSNASPRPLSTALEDLAARLAPMTTLARVQAVWDRAAGAAIADAARPSAERDGVLTLTCTASVWAQELELMADELLARVNAALEDDALHALRCRTV